MRKLESLPNIQKRGTRMLNLIYQLQWDIIVIVLILQDISAWKNKILNYLKVFWTMWVRSYLLVSDLSSLKQEKLLDLITSKSRSQRLFLFNLSLDIRKPRNSEQVIGVHPDYKIPLIFLKEETEWRYKYQNTQNSSDITGLLCPHVYITDNSGSQLSLRHLPEVIHQKLVSKNEENPENFVIALMFKDQSQNVYLEKVKQYLSEKESTHGKIIPILVNENQTAATADKENVYSCQNLDMLLSKLQSSKDHIILIRSDSIVLSKLLP